MGIVLDCLPFSTSLVHALHLLLVPQLHLEDIVSCAQLLLHLLSLLLLHKGVGDLFASVDGRDDYEECAARDDETKFAVSDVAVLIWII